MKEQDSSKISLGRKNRPHRGKVEDSRWPIKQPKPPKVKVKDGNREQRTGEEVL